MQSMPTIGFSSAAPVTSKAVASLFFDFLCLQVSSVSNFHPDTGGAGGHFLRLSCSVALWGWRSTADKYHRLWGALAASGPHWLCPCSWRGCFPGLHCSGSWVPCRETISRGPWVACDSQVQAAGVRVRGYSRKAHTLHFVHFGPAFCALPKSEQLRRPCAWECTLPGVQCIYHLPHPSRLVSWVPRERCAVCLLWGADLRLQPSWQMPTVQDLRETWLAIGSLLTAWWRMLSLG